MDRNTLLAFFLIALVLLFTPKYMELFYPQEEKTNETNQKEPVLPDNIKQRNNLPEAEKGDLILKPKPRQNSKEVLTSIETPLYKLLLSSVGGGTVKRFYIKEYLNNDSLPVNIINFLINICIKRN